MRAPTIASRVNNSAAATFSYLTHTGNVMNIIGKLAACAGLGLVLAAGVGFTPAHAGTHISIGIGVAPPPPRLEVIPAPRRGFVWVPGHWRWTHGRYVWRRGHWLARRVGYRYVRPHWNRVGGVWRFHVGYWRAWPHHRRFHRRVRYRHWERRHPGRGHHRAWIRHHRAHRGHHHH